MEMKKGGMLCPVHEHLWKGPDYDYDKRNISVVICDRDIPFLMT
jgi:hypothetical protein